MPETQNSFDQLTQIANEGGVEKTLDFLEHRFRSASEFFKLFEVLKMRCRHQLGLPLMYTQQPDGLSESKQRELEDGLLAACREVGTLLFKDGKLQEGWMYLQPVGDRQLSEKLIQSIKPDEENIDTLIEIAVSQGAAPDYGYGLLLENFGTCNAITTFDTQAMRFDKPTQKAMAQRLVRHLYDELSSNLRHCAEEENEKAENKKENKSVDENSGLAEMIEQHPWLVAGGAHHIDTTHLASVMRIARVVDDTDDLIKAAELADYGSGLHSDFQYPSSAPFENTYPDHKFFYQALLGNNVDAAIEHFKQKCESIDAAQCGPVAYEVLVDLLVRIGRKDEAIEVLTDNVLGKFDPMGIAPQIFDIAQSEDELKKLERFYRSQDDLLGFAVSVLKTSKSNSV